MIDDIQIRENVAINSKLDMIFEVLQKIAEQTEIDITLEKRNYDITEKFRMKGSR